ncbi:M14 family zinc carboxypeptidase [Xylophilus sp. GOD-11R]|uniref:M14 family zinc carboxypeptidase n=1 Tax=Xylophilus sp. GOD-11R TaxID=3089814 RepID=UPI00298D2AC5|nr:M14 family zinc carboxypeptidase [Xylophilus sp. GOD-11R]WPB58243.1 M14 family zinc carboxypeptidase [Xylophilus sp. GOD-11R]
MPSPHHLPTASTRPARRPRLALTAPMALSLALAACSSTPLPTWNSGTPAAPASRQPVPARPATPTAPPVVDMGPGVEVMPIRPRDDIAPGLPASQAPVDPTAPAPPPAPVAEVPPYGPAVAARFPEPTVRYATPGLADGRSTYTSNTELRAWLAGLATASGNGGNTRAGVVSLGSSQRGEALEALVLTRSANTEPSTLLADGRPTVLLIGQQRGDEPATAEALLILAREAAQGLLQPLLGRINIIVLPRANPDGAAAGTALTTDGTDLARDHLVLRTPEARAIARLVRDYKPVVLADAREYPVTRAFAEKFGAVQRADVLLQYATPANEPEFVTKAAEEWLRRPVSSALERSGLSQDWYFTASDDPAVRTLTMAGAMAGDLRNTEGLKNIAALMVASRGQGLGRLHLQRRVHSQVVALSGLLQGAATRADELRKLREFVDRDVASLACRADAAIDILPTTQRRSVTLLDPATGADRAMEVEWNSYLVPRTVISRRRPCGYWLDASASGAVDRLRDAGVQVMRVMEPSSLLIDAYRETARRDDPTRGTVLVDVTVSRALADVPQGGFYVPASQPLGNLIFAALEPDSPDSFFARRVIDRLDAVGRVATVPALRLEEY